MRVLWRDPDEFRGGDVLPGGEASTGPRSGERGDVMPWSGSPVLRLASTGPRSGERGDPSKTVE